MTTEPASSARTRRSEPTWVVGSESQARRSGPTLVVGSESQARAPAPERRRIAQPRGRGRQDPPGAKRAEVCLDRRLRGRAAA